MKIVYKIENLTCPHCAGKIERAVQSMEGIRSASLAFEIQQLHLEVEDAYVQGLLERIQATADAIEDGVVFMEKNAHSHLKDTEHSLKCSHEHCHCHEHSHTHEQGKQDIWILGISTALFVCSIIAEFLPVSEWISKILCLTAYLIMGWEVLWASVKSIGKGQIFDENFLMSIATIGALCIGCWEEAAGVMLFFRIGELFEHLAVERSRKSVMDAIDLRPETVQRITENGTETIPADMVHVGDRLLVRVGDRIPIDGIIRKGKSSLNTAAMTGESVPVDVAKGSSVMSGCINLSGVLEIEASAELGNSMVTRILESVENAAAGKPKIDRFITRFARVYTPVVVAIALLTAIVPSLLTGNWNHWIYTALNFLMISCPCALVLSVPLAFFSGIGAGSAKGILFKDGMSLEVLHTVKAVVMDKTGTLTNGNFSVVDTSFVEKYDAMELLQNCAVCEAHSTHPIAQSILQFVTEKQIPEVTAEQIQEIAGKGIVGYVGGKRIACGNSLLMQEEGAGIPEESKEARNTTNVFLAVDGTYAGCITLSDTPKEHAKETVQSMNRQGLHTVMLTGDSIENASTVAETLGIAEFHAGLLPDEKLTLMQRTREVHGAVLFVGDGINDAPVLSGADVGAAMGSGADAAMEAADVVFLRSDPMCILKALEIAGRVNRTAKGCIVFALAVKIGIMLLGFLGFANMWLSVFADTGVTILCVLAVLFLVHFYYRKH